MYVLIRPRWILLILVIRGRLIKATALGPVFSSQVWSIIWLAIVCPKMRASLGASRWITVGKKPSMFEKWCVGSWGMGFNCLLVMDARSRATRKPAIVTRIAAILIVGGIVMTGVFKGVRKEVISKPAMMLPQARRLRGLITVGLFSLMGERGVKRGFPMETKKTSRRL